MKKILKYQDGKTWFFGVFLGLLLFLGSGVYKNHDAIGERSMIKNLLCIGVLTLVCSFGFMLLKYCLEKWDERRAEKRKEAPQKWERLEYVLEKKGTWAGLYALFALVNLICLLVYYPGIVSYDCRSQFLQALGYETLTNHHPVLHTWLIGLFLRLGSRIGSLSKGIFCYCFLQQQAVAFTYTRGLFWLKNRKVHSLLVLLGAACYLFLPIFQIFSAQVTKDVLFSCALILFLLEFQSYCEEGGKRRAVFSLLCGIITVLLRNNMLYVFMLLFLAGLFTLRTKRQKGLIFCIMAAGILWVKAFLPMLGIGQEDRRAESLSVPIQQLACVYHNGEATEDEKTELERYMPDIGDYNPRYADPVKDSFDGEYYTENKSGFWDLYFSLGVKEPEMYLASFLDLNISYWYPFSETPDAVSGVSYIETKNEVENAIEYNSKLPGLHHFYQSFAEFEAGVMKLPVVSIFFSLSFPFLTLLLSGFVMAERKEKSYINVYLALCFLFLSYLLGPVSNFRYVYPYYMFLPIYLPVFLAGRYRD